MEINRYGSEEPTYFNGKIIPAITHQPADSIRSVDHRKHIRTLSGLTRDPRPTDQRQRKQPDQMVGLFSLVAGLWCPRQAFDRSDAFRVIT